MRKWASSLLPKHAAVAGWKHRAQSFLEQNGLPPMPEDRGAEQGDVDGPLECSLALGMVAAEARLHVAVQEAARTLPWIDTNDSVEEHRLQAETMTRCSGSKTFSSVVQENILELMTRWSEETCFSQNQHQLPEPHTNRRMDVSDEMLNAIGQSLQAVMLCKKNGGLADQWYVSVTQYWCCPIHRRSTQLLTLKLEHSEPHGKQKSSTTSQTWTQLLLSGKSAMLVH